jgi:hypothetical protein
MPDQMSRAKGVAQRLNTWKHKHGSEALIAIQGEAKALGQELFDSGGKQLLVRTLNDLKASGVYAGALDKEWECFYY